MGITAFEGLTEAEKVSLVPQPQSASSVALASSIVAVSGQCWLYGVQVNNTKASVQFILLFDNDRVPASGSVPVASFTAAASTNLGIYYGSIGRYMQRGIVLVNSSTSATFTVGSADCYFDVQFTPRLI
jgi:hypothetical protein